MTREVFLDVPRNFDQLSLPVGSVLVIVGDTVLSVILCDLKVETCVTLRDSEVWSGLLVWLRCPEAAVLLMEAEPLESVRLPPVVPVYELFSSLTEEDLDRTGVECGEPVGRRVLV